MATVKQRFHGLATKCLERIEATNVKGPTRQHEAALHFYCGAASVLAEDDPFRAPLATWIALILATRGMVAVRVHASGTFTEGES